VTVSAVFVPNEKLVSILPNRHSAEDNRSFHRKIHVSVDKQSDLEAIHMSQDSNIMNVGSRSFKKSHSFYKKKSKNNAIIGKLVVVVTDSGVGLSLVNLKRLFKEVFNTSVHFQSYSYSEMFFIDEVIRMIIQSARLHLLDRYIFFF
jgi:hypothetical protein